MFRTLKMTTFRSNQETFSDLTHFFQPNIY